MGGQLVFTCATPADAKDVVALHQEVARHRSQSISGARPWKAPSEAAVIASMRTTETVLARHAGELVASFRLEANRGFHGVARFTAVRASLYLLEMAVLPSRQRQGIGRQCLEEAERRARATAAEAIRLDTNDDTVRAAAFYQSCGYREVLRYAQTIYLERLLTTEEAHLR